jgi:hypothetical protein
MIQQLHAAFVRAKSNGFGRQPPTACYAMRRPLGQDILYQQAYKFIYTQTCLPDDSSQGTPVQHFVVRHNYLSKGFIASQDQMTTCLSLQVETCPFKRPNTLAP